MTFKATLNPNPPNPQPLNPKPETLNPKPPSPQPLKGLQAINLGHMEAVRCLVSCRADPEKAVSRSVSGFRVKGSFKGSFDFRV